jgi:alkylation response protein AidB-like acyl-CoA dehydrogenase
MDLRFTAREEAFRREVGDFIAASLPERTRRKMLRGQLISREETLGWQAILEARGWGAPHWPVEWGGCDWTPIEQYLYREEMQRAPAPQLYPQNMNLVGPVIIAFGTEAQKQRFLPRIRTMEYWFCQGFSEPNSGSDLASLTTRAERRGDHYLVNGQKIWTSNAHNANWMFALVRTDPTVCKQEGISYLLIDMASPGITVRPIITLDGAHHTNEVFLDNVEVPVANLIGEENKGWTYAKYLLRNERTNIARVGMSKARIARAKALAAETIVDGRPLIADPVFRQKVALIEVELKALEITTMRVVDEQRRNEAVKGDIKPSLLKLKGSEIFQATSELFVEIGGPDAMPRSLEQLRGDGAGVRADWQATAAPDYFYERSASIFGGSNEIQRNIVGKTLLGL